MGDRHRIEWIDVAKYICIIFVICSHSESCTQPLFAFFLPFVLEAFYFVSGYTYQHKTNFKIFLYKKFRQLFVPWLVFSLLIILSAQVISFHSHDSLLSELMWNFLQIRSKGDRLWFVAALFMAYIPFYAFISLYENCLSRHRAPAPTQAVIILVTFILSFLSRLYVTFMPPEILPWGSTDLPWHLEDIFYAPFFMTLGYFFRHKFETYFQILDSRYGRISLLAAYMLLVYVPYVSNLQMAPVNGIFYNYLSSIAGIIVTIAYSKVVRPNKYICYIGQNTLICFALHGKLLSITQAIINKFAHGFYAAVLNSTVASSVFALCFSLALSVILIVPIYIINRWFPFVLGRQYLKH